MIEIKSSKAVKATLVVMAVTLGSRVLGFLREVLMGNHFGVSYEMDAYVAATTIPMILFYCIVAAIATSFIPVYSIVKIEKSEKESILFTNKVLNIVLIVSIISSILGMIFTKSIVSFIAMGFDHKTMNLTVQLTRIIFPSIIFIGITEIYAGFLQSNKQFVIPVMMSIPNSIVIMIALSMSDVIGIQGIVWATLLGAVLQVFIQLPWLKRQGYFYQWVVDLQDPKIIYMSTLIVPVLIGTAVGQINLLVDRMLASGLIEGSISALNFANKVNGVLYSIVAVSISIVFYPILADLNAAHNMEQFKKMMVFSLNVIILLMIPMAIGIIVLRVPIIQVLFEHGKFDSRATSMTASALLFFTIGILFGGLRDVLSKAFYALQDTKTPMMNGAIAVALNIGFNLVLVRSMGHNGLALGSSLSIMFATLLLFYSLRKTMGNIGGSELMIVGLKCLVASIFMGIGIHITYQLMLYISLGDGFVAQVIPLGVSILSGGFIYIALIYLFKVKEFYWIMNMVSEKLESIRKE